MANEAGPGCQELTQNLIQDTIVSGDTATVAGTITHYRLELATDPVTDYDVAFSMQGKDNGTFSYINNTHTGIMTVGSAYGAECVEFVGGIDFTVTQAASIGDYLSCYYEGAHELEFSGGDGAWYYNNANQTEGTTWTPTGSGGIWDLGIGVDITAVGEISGETCWGHVTGVTEANVRTFLNNWTGIGTIGNSGDTERLELNSGEYMISEVVNTGTETVILKQNEYDPSGDNVDMDYRHGADVAACEVASWNNYTAPFVSLGYVQIRMTSTL